MAPMVGKQALDMTAFLQISNVLLDLVLIS